MHILYMREWGSVISMVCCALITELCDVDVRAWAPTQPGGQQRSAEPPCRPLPFLDH